MIRSIVIGFITAILFVGISTYINLKAYKEANIYYDTMPSYTLIYTNVTGDYVQTSTMLKQVEELLKKSNIPCPQTFGLFLDDPNIVVVHDLKSKVGCIYFENPLGLTKIPDGLEKRNIKSEDNQLSADFEGSPALGPRKVYAKAQTFVSDNSLFPALEIYSYNQKNELTTKYFFNLKF